MEIINKIKVQASQGATQDPIPKITKAKRARGMAQMVDCLTPGPEFKTQYHQK
jgi:hypothetical protein